MRTTAHNSAQLRCFENGNDDFGVEAFWIGDAARVGYFVPLNGPLNGHPPSGLLLSLRKPNRATELGGSTVTVSWKKTSDVLQCIGGTTVFVVAAKQATAVVLDVGAIIHIVCDQDEQSRSAST